MTFLTVVSIWYLLGLIPLLICLYVDYEHGLAITYSDLVWTVLASLFGPIVWVPCVLILWQAHEDKLHKWANTVALKKNIPPKE
jgi:hypothetical protein